MKKRKLMFNIQWHITSLCPNRCKHCYIDEKCDDSITYEQFCKAYRKIEAFEERNSVSITRITLSGGDPLVNPNVWKILDFLHKKGKELVILGIPEQLTAENVSHLKELGVCNYQISLDGLEETHDMIRGKGSFRRTIEALKFMTMHQLNHSVMFTANSLNSAELIPLIEYLDHQSIQTDFAFDFMVGDVSGAENMPSMVDADDAKRILIAYYEVSKELTAHRSSVTVREKNGISKVIRALYEGAINENVQNYPFCNGCTNGIYSISILPNGDVYPCRRLPIKIGNIFSDELDYMIFEHDLMRRFRDSTNYQYCGDCQYFNMCRGCAAISYAFSGDPFSQYPYCFIKKEATCAQKVSCPSLDSIINCEPNLKHNLSKKDYILRLLKMYNEMK